MKWSKEPSGIIKPSQAQPMLVNVPTEVVKPVITPVKGEVTEFYIYPKDAILYIDGMPSFRPNKLINLSSRYSANSDYAMSGFTLDGDYLHFYSTGKETIRVWPDDKAPMFGINVETGEYRFWPKFFQTLAKVNFMLVRISAPQKWHDERTAARIDPTFSIEWEAEFK